jgi:hypothetical protein
MAMFLLILRKGSPPNQKLHFEIDDFGILSLARLPIPPPWRVDF